MCIKNCHFVTFRKLFVTQLIELNRPKNYNRKVKTSQKAQVTFAKKKKKTRKIKKGPWVLNSASQVRVACTMRSKLRLEETLTTCH